MNQSLKGKVHTLQDVGMYLGVVVSLPLHGKIITQLIKRSIC